MTLPTGSPGFATPRQRMQRKLIHCECEARGITIVRRGECYVLAGAGVDIMTRDLAHVEPHELRPHGVSVRRPVDVGQLKDNSPGARSGERAP